MLIDRVTFTGADESVTPEQLAAVQKDCPRIEWGILLSKRGEGAAPRFPGPKWLDNLAASEVQLPMLSGHLCGRWVRDLLIGSFTYRAERADHFRLWKRIQLNFAASSLEPVEQFWWELAACHDRTTFIFQVNGTSDYLYYSPASDEESDDEMGEGWGGGAMARGLNAVPLFDHSGGKGIVPRQWIPIPHAEVLTGYAGGLGPDNLADELKRIHDAVGDSTIWIDLETKVRSDDDKVFDLNKVRRCYDIARPYLRPQEE